MSEKLLEIKDLKVRYVVGKEVSEAVNGISLTLNKGETLGLVGSTGWSTGAHLHFEVRIDGIRVDPKPLIFPDEN